MRERLRPGEQQGAADPQLLPIGPLAQRLDELRRLPGPERDPERVGGPEQATASLGVSFSMAETYPSATRPGEAIGVARIPLRWAATSYLSAASKRLRLWTSRRRGTRPTRRARGRAVVAVDVELDPRATAFAGALDRRFDERPAEPGAARGLLDVEILEPAVLARRPGAPAIAELADAAGGRRRPLRAGTHRSRRRRSGRRCRRSLRRSEASARSGRGRRRSAASHGRGRGRRDPGLHRRALSGREARRAGSRGSAPSSSPAALVRDTHRATESADQRRHVPGDDV